MSYMVMECHTGYAVLLDEEGRFVKAANFRYSVGQTVYAPVLMRDAPSHNAARRIYSAVAVIAACIALLLGFSYYENYLRAYSSIYLSINPEVQMDLNRQGTVVGVYGTNDDGELLVEGYNGRGKDKTTVADELIDRAIDMGFLSEGGRISFSIDTPDDVLFQEYGVELRENITKHLDGRITVVIEIVNYGAPVQGENTEDSSTSSPDSTSNQTIPDDDIPEDTSSSGQSSVAPPAGDSGYGSSDYSSTVPQPEYNDTDYGAGSDGVTDYTPPPADTSTGGTPPSENTSTGGDVPAAGDSNYDGNSNYGDTGGDSNYTDGNTDYDPENAASDYDGDDD